MLRGFLGLWSVKWLALLVHVPALLNQFSNLAQLLLDPKSAEVLNHEAAIES